MTRNKITLTLTAWTVCVCGHATAEQQLYWTDWGSSNNISRSNLDGSDPEPVIVDQFQTTFGLAVDEIAGKVYIAEGTCSNLCSEPLNSAVGVYRANLNGTGIEPLILGSAPTDIVLDGGGKMYWTDFGNNQVNRANLDGTNHEVLISGPFSNPFGIALDLSGGKIYLADTGGFGSGSTPSIARANLNGSGLELLVTGGRPTDIALDLANGRMYWTDFAGPVNVFSANLDGSDVQPVLAAGLFKPYGITLDPDASKMYLTDWGGDGVLPSISRANLNGSGFEVLNTAVSGPTDIVLVSEPPTGTLMKMFVLDAPAVTSPVQDLNGLSAKAKFTLDPNNPTELIIELINTSTGVPSGFDNADQLLSAVSFDFGHPGFNGDPEIVSGTVVIGPDGESINFDNVGVQLSEGDDVTGEWAYGNMDGTGLLTNFVSSSASESTPFGGANLDGPVSIDGPQASIAANPPLIPLGGVGAVADSIVITLTLDQPLENLDFLMDNGVMVEFGSDAAFLVPEPGPALALVLGSLAMLCRRARNSPSGRV